MLEIDHAVLMVTDPAATADDFAQRAGLHAVPGGRHTGVGTANWIVPLGSSYIELLHVVDEGEAADSTLGRWVQEQTRNGDRLAALCVRTDDIEGVAGRSGGRVTSMRREGEGPALEWRMVGLEEAMSDACLPFFVQWDVDDEQHPARIQADHTVVPDGIAWVEYGGDAERLADWLGDHTLPIRCTDGRPGPKRLAITTADGPVLLGATGLL